MNSYLLSTFFPTFSCEESGSTMKKVSSSILPGENTDGNVKFSIFDLPKEIIEKIEKELKPNHRKQNQYERE